MNETNWDIRLLSKSNLLPKVAQGIIEKFRFRVIYGVSTGTFNDGIARTIESGTPLVSKRVDSLRWLQDNGYRTFAMICPSLPLPDDDAYRSLAALASSNLRTSACEHVWAEVINLRGESFTRTVTALANAGYGAEAARLEHVSNDKTAWEKYARDTFLAHREFVHPSKLRFLQYVTKSNIDWWAAERSNGAVLLGDVASTPVTPSLL